MNTTALIYSFKSNKSAQVAEKIKELWNGEIILLDADDLTVEKFMPFKNYILSVPTWFDGELPKSWDEFVPALEDLNLKGKLFAIYGNGDQVNYSENFADAVGIMADLLEFLGGKIVGYTSLEGYSFEKSKAQRGSQFCGLVLDFENQAKQNNERIVRWVEQLKKEFQ